MAKRFVFSNDDQAVLVKMLGENAPIDGLANVVTNVLASREYDASKIKPRAARELLNTVSQSAWELLGALEALPVDLRDTYLSYLESEKHISSKDDIDVDLLGFVFSLALAADSAVSFDNQIRPKRGRPRDDSQWLFAISIAHILRKAGHKVTSTESGLFVSILDLCAPSAGFELEEIRQLARMVTSGKKWP